MRMKDDLEAGAVQLEEKRLSHVLLIYREMIPSIRLCGHCQMEYLAKLQKAEYRSVQEMRLKSSDLNWADVVLLGRLDNWYEYQLSKKLHESGKYVVYIIDDDLLNIPLGISSAAYYGRREIQGYIRKMIEMSDAIMSPSPLLLEKYAINGRRGIQIEEPAISPASYRIHEPNQPMKIGFAGSVDRTGDIELVLRDALFRIKSEFAERVQFEFFGAIPSFAEALNARSIPYCASYDVYRESLNNLAWDIGIAPMPDTTFHACKHYNKFVEYAAAGIVGVFSDVQPYTRLKSAGRPGKYCPNEAEAWYTTIKELIEDDNQREHLRCECVRVAREEFDVSQLTIPIQDALEGIGRCGDKSVSEGWLLLTKMAGVVARSFLKIKQYGVRFPIAVYKKLVTSK